LRSWARRALYGAGPPGGGPGQMSGEGRPIEADETESGTQSRKMRSAAAADEGAAGRGSQPVTGDERGSEGAGQQASARVVSAG